MTEKVKIILRLLLFASMWAVAICGGLWALTSCCSRKIVETVSSCKDSVSVKVEQDSIVTIEYRQEPVFVPMSETKLELDIDSIRQLPRDASYTSKNGQSNLRVKRKNNIIYIEASCDSLILQCMKYEKAISQMKKTIQDMKKHEQKNSKTKTKKDDILKKLSDGIVSIFAIIGFASMLFLIFRRKLMR